MAERALEIGIDTDGFLVHTLQKAMIEADFIVVLGGDGTILSMAQHAAPYHVPIFGANMGHVGVMTEVEFPEFRMIQRIFEGKYTIDDRMMLDVDVIRGDQLVYRSMALNEAIVKTGSIFRISLLDIFCDRQVAVVLPARRRCHRCHANGQYGIFLGGRRPDYRAVCGKHLGCADLPARGKREIVHLFSASRDQH